MPCHPPPAVAPRSARRRRSPLSLVALVNAAVDEVTDSTAALAFIEPVAVKVTADPMAAASLNTTKAQLHVRLGELDTAAEVLKQCERTLDDMPGVTPVHADYYRVAADLEKIRGHHAEFYRHAIRYLGCVAAEDLPEAEAAQRAHDLGLAALLGKGIYNVGELLAHGIMDSLRGSKGQWLVDLLEAFNGGDVVRRPPRPAPPPLTPGRPGQVRRARARVAEALPGPARLGAGHPAENRAAGGHGARLLPGPGVAGHPVCAHRRGRARA